MNRFPRHVVGLLLFAAACSDDAETPTDPTAASFSEGNAVQVSSPASAGPGSFRSAVRQANNDPSIGTIRFAPGLDPIRLDQPVTYSGAQALVINGNGARINGGGLPAGASVLVADGGGDLTLRALTVSNAPGNGITVKVPDGASGLFTVRLNEVVIRENGLHGILINDQAEYFTDPASPSEAGSAANLLVEVFDSRFGRNGFGLIDSDGLRINEGGNGHLEARVHDTDFFNNGADGLELDERGLGDARFILRHTALIGNGSFSEEDFDDGIDVDESGGGDVAGDFEDVLANKNFEQGVDLNENGPGDLRIFMRNVRAAENNEEGIEFEEDDDVAGGGNIRAHLAEVTTRANGRAGGDAGLKLREKGPGSLQARLVETVSLDNRLLSGDDPIAGILLQEDEGGQLNAELVQVAVRRNSGDGIQFEENEAGGLTGQIRRSVASENGGAGASLTQATPGTGRVTLTRFAASRNAGGAVVSEGVEVNRTP